MTSDPMTMITIEEANEILAGEHKKQHVSKHRWYDRYLIVFERDGTLEGFYYNEPATEEQEGMDVYDGDSVRVFPVTAKDVMTTIYQRRSHEF